MIREMALADFRYIDSEDPDSEDKAYAMKILRNKIDRYREQFESWFKTNRQVFGDANVYVFPTIQDEEFVLNKIGKSISDSYSQYRWARSRYFDLDEEIIAKLGLTGPINLSSDVIFIPIINRGVKRGYLPGLQLFTPWMMFHGIADEADVESNTAESVPWMSHSEKDKKLKAKEIIGSLSDSYTDDEEEAERIGDTGFFRTKRTQRRVSKDPNYMSEYEISNEGINELFVDALLRPRRGPRINSTENFHGDKKDFVEATVRELADNFRNYCRGKLIIIKV